MFDFDSANDAQGQAKETTDGPVLITAGAGTGKKFAFARGLDLGICKNKQI